MIYKIFYQDTMTSYYLDDIFDTWDNANNFIYNNLGENSCYEIEELND